MKNSFLAKVAEELIKRGGDFSALNIVFPQRRAIEVFRSIWQKKFSIKDGGSPIEPTCFSVYTVHILRCAPSVVFQTK